MNDKFNLVLEDRDFQLLIEDDGIIKPTSWVSDEDHEKGSFWTKTGEVNRAEALDLEKSRDSINRLERIINITWDKVYKNGETIEKVKRSDRLDSFDKQNKINSLQKEIDVHKSQINSLYDKIEQQSNVGLGIAAVFGGVGLAYFAYKLYKSLRKKKGNAQAANITKRVVAKAAQKGMSKNPAKKDKINKRASKVIEVLDKKK